MRRSQALGILCAFTTAGIAAVACGDDDSTGGYTYDGGARSDGSTSGDGSASDGSTTGDGSTGGDGATGGDSGDGGAVTAKLVEFNAPDSPKKAKDGDTIHVTNVVATSPLFIISKNAKTCNYGVFVVDVNAAFVPYSGIFVFSTGAGTGDGGTACPMTSSLPADVKVGDTLDITGKYSLFANSGCGKAPNPSPLPAKGVELDVSASSKLGTATPPPAVDVTPNDLIGGTAPPAPPDGGADAGDGGADAGDGGADAGDDGGAVDAGPPGDPMKYSGALVRLTNITAKTKPDTFGVVLLDPSGLTVGDKIYINTAFGKPNIAVGQTFTSVLGIGGYLDFCSWAFEPRSPCDYTPAPVDAGVCPP